MIKFILLSIAFCLASAGVGFDLSFLNVTRADASCLAQQGITRASLALTVPLGYWNPKFLDNWIILQDAGIETVDVIVGFNDGWDTNRKKICNYLWEWLPRSFNGTIWFRIESFSWVEKIRTRIPYLEDLATKCKSHGFKVGIFSKPSTWA